MSILRTVRAALGLRLIGAVVFAFALSLATAQDPPPTTPSAPPPTPAGSDKSIAAAVRDSKAQKTAHAKKVFTEDDLDATTTALPRLKTDGADNGDDIVAAIGKYKETHTPEQTEAAVRAWYERYDEQLAAAIQENLDVKALRDENVGNGYELCRQSGDYQQCENRRQAEMVGARHDQNTMNRNTQLEVRIQHALMKVRNGLKRFNLHYDWFKVRTTNGINVF
jgi:hypothetical protein